jgi:hypothetical protein
MASSKWIFLPLELRPLAGAVVPETTFGAGGSKSGTRFVFDEERMPVKMTFSTEEILLRSDALFRAERPKDLRPIAEKTEDLRHYDVLATDRVVAILSCRRSGSLLLPSYLDGHDGLILLPELCAQRLCEIFNRCQSLSWCDNLLAYPAFELDYP